jgi:hypothetical protein
MTDCEARTPLRKCGSPQEDTCCKKEIEKQRIDPSWTRDKETSNALFIHGIRVKMQIPTHLILFEVTLRGERWLSRLGRAQNRKP